MPISMYNQSVPVLSKYLKNMVLILDKTAAHCEANKIDPTVLLNFRLYPDMFPFTRQVLIATDFARGSAARLIGTEPSKEADDMATIPELKARVERAIASIEALKEEQFVGSETRSISRTIGGKEHTFNGLQYLTYFTLPNFYFHLTAAYAVLRHNGVVLGKSDFLNGY